MFTEKEVIKNIIKIRNNHGLTKREVAAAININEASYGRIESGEIALSYDKLANIASALGLSVIDVITYPYKYALQDDSRHEDSPVEAVLQIKLKKDKKDQVLKLVFGENNIEILNK